jgi:Putative zinc- or iron-chelating domain
MTDERKTFGTAALDTPITRDDFERALRYLHLNHVDEHDLLMRLAAQVVALTEEVDRRLPAVAAPVAVDATDATAEATSSLATRVYSAVPAILDRIRAADSQQRDRVWLEAATQDKYELDTSETSPPCDELMHLCGARCCTMVFPLSTADLDEGVIRWDYGQPYMIRQRASDGFCVHNDPTSHGCTVHAQRPATCRTYDCRDDKRVWLDYAQRIPAPTSHLMDGNGKPVERFELLERARLRELGAALELNSIKHVFPEDEPRVGPPGEPRKRRPVR